MTSSQFVHVMGYCKSEMVTLKNIEVITEVLHGLSKEPNAVTVLFPLIKVLLEQ